MVKHNNAVVTYDWGFEVLTPTSHATSWAFLYSDCEHEVLPVKSGHRITLVYDVFTTGSGLATDSRRLPVSQGLLDMVASPTFFPEGITLGFGFSHSYPVQKRWKMEGRVLKGLDGILHRTLLEISKKFNVELEWHFAYDFERYYVSKRDQRESNLGRSPATVDHPFKFPYVVGSDPHIPEELYANAYFPIEELVEGGARYRDDVIWLSIPGKYDRAGSFVVEGNEVSSSPPAYLISGPNDPLLCCSLSPCGHPTCREATLAQRYCASGAES